MTASRDAAATFRAMASAAVVLRGDSTEPLVVLTNGPSTGCVRANRTDGVGDEGEERRTTTRMRSRPCRLLEALDSVRSRLRVLAMTGSPLDEVYVGAKEVRGASGAEEGGR